MKENKLGNKEIKEWLYKGDIEYRTSSDVSDYPNHIKINSLIQDLNKMKIDGATYIEFSATGSYDGEVDEVTICPCKVYIETDAQAIERNIKEEKEAKAIQENREWINKIKQTEILSSLAKKYPEYRLDELLIKLGKK